MVMSQQSTPGEKQRPNYWVPATLLVCGVVLAIHPLPFRSPVDEAVQVPAWATDTTPVRQPKLQPSYRVAVYTYRCSDCHSIIAPIASTDYRTALQHTEIMLQHGINTRCLNCHHATNRDAFAGDGDAEIPWDQPQLLCAKCHGPVYRDWQHGAHGRTNGYWSTSLGAQTRRRCIECHDPHQPPFPHMRPAPAPHTLRMGPQEATDESATHNPLRLRGATPGLLQNEP